MAARLLAMLLRRPRGLPKQAHESLAWGNYREGEPGHAGTAYREMVDETPGKTNVWLFGWLTETDFDQTLPLARELEASRIVLWESNAVGLPQENESFVRKMRECARSV